MTQALSEIIKGGALGKVVRNSQVVLLWKEAVEGDVLKNTQAVKLVEKVLYVEVKSPVWAQELNFLKAEIIKKLNQLAGYPAVTGIRFKAGG